MADEPEPQEKLTVRERRAQHARQAARKGAPGRIARKAIVPGVVLLVIAGIATGFYLTNKSQGECPGHWHVNFGVFVDGERVPFPQPPYQMAPTGDLPMSMHMHPPSQETLHIEPPRLECRGVAEMMNLLDVNLRADRLVLDGAHEQGRFGGTYEAEGNRTLRFFIQERGGEMKEMEWSKLRGRQLPDGTRLMIAFGSYTQAQVDEMMAQVPDPPGGPAPS